LTYRSAASLREERTRLLEKQARLGRPMSDDPATARVGGGLARRNAARMDRELAQATQLDDRIRALDSKIARAEAREARATARNQGEAST
ncbi:MAG: hypothetical protein L0H93_12225, partial [Nocardioides sp.]|nr:hypothetical protein [Nocardioides sp.]